MSKKDYRENYPDKIFIAPKEDIVRYHASSGTTGKPTIVGYTRNDIDNWSESLARSMTSAGLGSTMWSRSPTPMACSPEAWDSITPPSESERRSYRQAPATPRGRWSSSRTWA